MKTVCTIFMITLSLMVFTNCGTTTSTTSVTPPPVKETPPPPTISAQDKAEIKEELKEELKEEIKKELEIEQAQKPPKTDAEMGGINEPKKPAKPAKPTVMAISTAENILVGAWKWIETRKSIRGVGNQVNTPTSMGFEKTALFRQDGTCEILLNNIPAGKYNYKVTSDGIAQLFINFSSLDNNTQHMENGPLILEDNKFEILGTFNDRGANIKFERL